MEKLLLKSILKTVSAVFFSVVLIGLLSYTVVNIFIMESQSNVNDLKERIALGKENHRELTASLEEVTAPGTILEKATEFGMSPSSSVTYIPGSLPTAEG